MVSIAGCAAGVDGMGCRRASPPLAPSRWHCLSPYPFDQRVTLTQASHNPGENFKRPGCEVALRTMSATERQPEKENDGRNDG